MNERIKELALQAGLIYIMTPDKPYINEDLEKFALMIIEKCGDIADNSVDHGIPSAYIDEYFGV